MNTFEFLRKILPSSGCFIVSSSRVNPATNKPDFRNESFSTIEEAARKIEELDKQPTTTVYHACASYKNKLNGSKGRNQSNALAAKSFWLDLDCGHEKAVSGKGYENKGDAWKSLLSFIRTTNLPIPLLIDSGRGLHAYWVLENEISAEDWNRTATKLKSLFAAMKIITDPSRTSDIASVLRPVGSHNKKDPNNPREVVVKHEGVVTAYEDFDAKITAQLEKLGCSVLDTVPEYLKGASLTDENLISVYKQYEYNAEQIADQCGVMRHFRETQGDLNYDAWRQAIGLLTFCKNGEELAHAWSAKRAQTGHTNTDVATRFTSWNSGPSTCESFRSLCPGLCENCPQKVKTPLTLGRLVNIPTEDSTQGQQTSTGFFSEAPSEGAEEKPTVHEAKLNLYWWDSGMERMCTKVVDKKTKSETVVPFSYNRFYLNRRIRDTDGTHSVTGVNYDTTGRPHEFSIPVKYVASGGAQLIQELGKYEISPTNHPLAGNIMAGYLRDALNDLRHTNELTQSFTSFGWQDEGKSFLLGNLLYREGETPSKVLLRGYAKSKEELFKELKGSAEGYSKALNSIYARDGMEPMQYAIASLWAAPLCSLVEDSLYKGIPCALTGAKSGKGKTTAFTAALYAFGAADKMTIKGEQGATANARTAFLGALQSLPLLMDEITNIKSTELSNLAYVVSNGGDRNRLAVNKNSGGVDFADTASWCTQIGLTGNSCLIDRLSQNGNADAEAMRIFEIRVDDYNIPVLDTVFVSEAMHELEENAGSVGPMYIDYIMNNQVHVRALLAESFRSILESKYLPIDPKYRFYRWHMVTTLTAAKIMTELGVCKFDLEKLTAFAKEAVAALCANSAERNELTPAELINEFIHEKSELILVTRRLSNLPPEDLQRIQNKPYIGRLLQWDGVIEDDLSKCSTFIVSRAALKDWCTAHRADIKKLEKDLKAMGALMEPKKRSYINQGVPHLPTIQIWCVWISLSALKRGDDDSL